MVPPRCPGHSKHHSAREPLSRYGYRARQFCTLPVDSKIAKACQQYYLVASVQAFFEGFQEETIGRGVASLLEEVYSILRARSAVRH